MTDLRDQIEDIIRRRLSTRPRPHLADALNNDLTAAIRPVLTAKDAEIEQLTDQIRTIRTLQAMWAKLGTHGLPVEREVFAQVARDLSKVLGQPGDQEGTT